ncbi:hypothetical protein [Candidatus Amarolinea aalborgensis]|jgi:hypothetical protein|uniref:hypothetical protein n=1 Tax=Candidatus Amarolinea aalborgensis TaxID=2249329 RepID=UPI003BF9A462
MMLMEDTTIADLLSSYAERLFFGDDHSQDYLALFPELRPDLHPLLRLTRDLAAWMRPVKPRAAFRQDLRRALVATGYRQLSPSLALEPLERDSRRDWMLGAAAIGSAVSVVGVLAYLWRNRDVSEAPTLPVQ